MRERLERRWGGRPAPSPSPSPSPSPDELARSIAERLRPEIEAVVQRVLAEERRSSSAPVPHGTYIGNGRVLVHLVTGGSLLVRSDDLSLLPELLRNGSYDLSFARFVQRVLQPDDVFVDVGANVGLFTVLGGYQAWRGRTIAYEPAPPMLELLHDNVAMNWFTDRVTVRGVAVGAAPGRAAFGFPVHQHMLGGLAVTAGSLQSIHDRVEVAEFDVEIVTLDDDLADVDRTIALVKIDVEGGEIGVLDGMRGLLRRGMVDRISVEVRAETQARNRGVEQWNALAARLADLADGGWTFSELDLAGGEVGLTIGEVLERALFSNLVITRPGLSS